jgi:16S rRNA (guanine(966)-N(2))-methyltransferase RsmD
MRINSGRAKGRLLRTVPTNRTRPVTDRVKQAVFNILGDDVKESRWLDLFAGTGAIGIEALSRGASQAVFIDTAPAAVQTIQLNLEATRLQAGARVLRRDAFDYVRRPPDSQYDFIYVAPPQYQGLWDRALLEIDANPGWLAQDGAVIAQIDPREYQDLELKALELVDRRRYGATLLCFYEHLSGDDLDDGGHGVE